MSQQHKPHEPEPKDQHPSDDAPSLVPNRRERRGAKTGAPTGHDGKLAPGRRSAPVVPPRQYSTRRRSG